MNGTINNAANQPLFFKSGDVPDVSGAILQYYQPLVFTPVTKVINGFQVVETGDPILFRGLIVPFTPRQLLIKEQGERAWSWYSVYSDPVLTLQVDDVILYNEVQYRVMARTNFSLFGYQYYELVSDWKGAGPL